MRIGAMLNSVLLVFTLAFTGPRAVPRDPGPTSRALHTAAAVTFQLSSPVFSDGAAIPPAYTCDAANRAPALQWKGAPPGTRSFVLIMDDADAHGGTFTHWVLFNIPGTVDQLPAGLRPRQVGMSGRNDFGSLGYGGSCPPSGVHWYFPPLHALDAPSLSLPEGALCRQMEQAMQGHVD